MSDDPTLATYETAAARYRDARPAVAATEVHELLDRFAGLVGRGGTVLELGSGPGYDAVHLESRGLRVIRTDGAQAFVDMLRAEGHGARLLDIRSGEFGGPYGGILADAVLLHLDRDEFAAALVRARAAIADGGLFAFTIKEGDGEAWSTAKLDLPRHFTYWRADAVRRLVVAAGWQVVSLEHVSGRLEPWLHVLARAAPPGQVAARS